MRGFLAGITGMIVFAICAFSTDGRAAQVFTYAALACMVLGLCLAGRRERT